MVKLSRTPEQVIVLYVGSPRIPRNQHEFTEETLSPTEPPNYSPGRVSSLEGHVNVDSSLLHYTVNNVNSVIPGTE